jgi:hypothetical protein
MLSSTMGMRRTTLVAGLAVCGLAVGCSSSASTPDTSQASKAPSSPTSAVPAGYVEFVDRESQFSIAVPSSWHQVNPSSPGASQVISSLVAANPRLKSVLGSAASLAADGMKFLAVDASSIARVPSINVIVQPALGTTDSDLPKLLNEVKSEYAKIGATLTSNSYVQLAGHTALHAAIVLHEKTSTGVTLDVPENQYLLFANDFGYNLTLAARSPRFATILTTFEVSTTPAS